MTVHPCTVRSLPKNCVFQQAARVGQGNGVALNIKPLAETFVAEVRGADLRGDIDETCFAEIHQAFLKYGVVVLPGQDLTLEQHKIFGQRFGEIFSIPVRDPTVKVNHVQRRFPSRSRQHRPD